MLFRLFYYGTLCRFKEKANLYGYFFEAAAGSKHTEVSPDETPLAILFISLRRPWMDEERTARYAVYGT